MTADATLTSVEAGPAVQAVAAARLGHDPRLHLVTQDAAAWLTSHPGTFTRSRTGPA